MIILGFKVFVREVRTEVGEEEPGAVEADGGGGDEAVREHAVDVPHGLAQITHVTETLQLSRRQVTVAMATPANKGKNILS